MSIREIILMPIFIILLVIIFHAIKSGSGFSGIVSLILSLCVSALAIMGMADYLKNMIDVILLPYAAMGISILLLLLLSLVGKHFKNNDLYFSKDDKKRAAIKEEEEKLNM